MVPSYEQKPKKLNDKKSNDYFNASVNFTVLYGKNKDFWPDVGDRYLLDNVFWRISAELLGCFLEDVWKRFRLCFTHVWFMFGSLFVGGLLGDCSDSMFRYYFPVVSVVVVRLSSVTFLPSFLLLPHRLNILWPGRPMT